MTIEPWYSQLITPLESIYNDFIIIYDPDELGKLDDVVSALSRNYTLLYYQNELRLRYAIKGLKEKKVLIFVSDDPQRIPYDIESRAEKINDWNLKKIFPKFECQVLKEYPTRLQEIHERYKKIEGSLKIANHIETKGLIQSWITDDPRCREIKNLVKSIQGHLNNNEPHWNLIAPLWGRLSYFRDYCSEDIAEYENLDKKIIEKFDEFIDKKYSDNFYASSKDRPLTVNKVMEYLENFNTEKILLLCFDGMSFQEWYVLKSYLEKHGITKFREDSTLALLPTVTKISRRALFSGKKDYENPIEERKGFSNFIEENWKCEDSKQIGFTYNAGLKWNPEYLNYDYLGIIINLFDDRAHATGNVGGSKLLMQKDVMNILQETTIEDIFREFIKAGYRIFITSDHGTIWCLGNGYRSDKYLVEDRARRALLYPNKILAMDFATHKEVKIFENNNLLGERVLVFPKGREMFATKNETAITHGGIHLEEVIIPFIEVLP